MSVSSGPSPITSNLVFGFDTGNPKKFLGGRGTNRMILTYGGEVGPWTVNGTNTDVTYTDVGRTAPVPHSKTWKFVKTGTSSQWNGWESGYSDIWTGLSGDYWTTSFWYKTIAPAGLTGFGVGGFAKSDWSGYYNTTLIDWNASIIADGQWHYAYAVTRFDEDYTSAIIADGPSWGYSSQAGELYINGLQWTKTAYPTQFISIPDYYNNYNNTGTTRLRRTEQCIFDLASNTTIDTYQASFSTDGSLNFNGTSNVVTADDNTALNTQTLTMEAWVKPTTLNQDGFIFEKGTVNTQYSMFFSNASFIFRTIGLNAQDLSFTSSSYLTSNIWNHIVCTYGSGTKTIYVNGTQVAQQTGLTGTISTSNTGISIGAYGGRNITATKWIGPENDQNLSYPTWVDLGNYSYDQGDVGYYDISLPFNVTYYTNATQLGNYSSLLLNGDGYLQLGSGYLFFMQDDLVTNSCYTKQQGDKFYVYASGYTYNSWYYYNYALCFYNGKPYFDFYPGGFIDAEFYDGTTFSLYMATSYGVPLGDTILLNQFRIDPNSNIYDSYYENDGKTAYRITPATNARSYYYSGKIGVCKVYNIALTASQVKQNFNALRGRYGI